MSKESRIISYVFCKILLFMFAILAGSYGNIYIGIASFVIGCLMLIAGILQLNKMNYAAYGSILLLLSASSYHRQWSFLSSVVSCGNLTITDYGK